LLQHVNHDALRSYSADPYSTYAPTRFNILSSIKLVMDSAATVAIQNKVKDYNDRAKQLFQESVKLSLEHNTAAIINMFAPFSSLGGGMVVLVPAASAQRDTQFSGVAFPAQQTPGKRIKLVHFDPDDQTCASYVPTLAYEDADKMRETSGSAAYPAIKTLTATDYYVIGGHIGALPVDIHVMISELQHHAVTPMVTMPMGSEAEDVYMPQLLTPGAIDTITNTTPGSEYAVPLDTDRVLSVVRAAARERQAPYLAEVQAAIAELRQVIGVNPPAGPDTDRRRDALSFLERCRQTPADYVLFYRRIDHTDPDNMPLWHPRQHDGPTAVYWDASVAHRAYVARDLATFTTPETPIAAAPVKRDVTDQTPVTVLGPMYRFQTQSVDNETRFRLNYVRNSGMGPALSSGQIRDGDDAADDLHGFDADMKRFEYDLQVRNYEGYGDEIRTFLRVMLQTMFSKTRRPDPTKIPVIGMVDLNRAKKTDGFLFVPSVSTAMDNDPQFKASLRIPVAASSPAEFYRSYPRWTVPDQRWEPADPMGNTDDLFGDIPVSSAALFLWRHAVSRNTTPFSATADTSNLADVATILATIDPFPVYDKTDVGMCSRIQASIERHVLPKLKVKPGLANSVTLLHLIQLTGSQIRPGNTNFAQPFPPLSVHFPDTAIRKWYREPGQSQRYRLEYTLGCQATVLLESITIVTALLRVLLLNNIPPAPRDDDDDDSKDDDNRYADDDDPTVDIPETHMVPETLPLFQSDKEYKEHTLASTTARAGIYGLTNSFTSARHPDGRVILTDYYKFYGLDTDLARNKAARVILGTTVTSLSRGGNPTPGQSPTSAPGVYGDYSADFPALYNIDTATHVVTPDPGTTFLSIKVQRDPYTNMDALAASRTVYDDYILHDLLTTRRGDATTLRTPPQQTLPDLVQDARPANVDVLTSETGGITLPVYRLEDTYHYDRDGHGPNNPELVAFVTVDNLVLDVTMSAGLINDDGTMLPGTSTLELMPYNQYPHGEDRITSEILAVRSVMDSTLIRHTTPGQRTAIQFNSYDTGTGASYKYYVGVYISDAYLDNFSRSHPTNQLHDPGQPFTHHKTRFLPLIDVTDTRLIPVSDVTWGRNMSAYEIDWEVPRPIDHTNRMLDTTTHEIAGLLADGLLGFHFSKSTDGGRTTFAVPIGHKAAEVVQWYTRPENPAVFNEPRGIHLISPDNRNDAMLVQLVQEGEAQGNSLTYTSSRTTHSRLDAVSMDALITPVVVMVRGPGVGALSTPCYIEHVYAKTSAYRFVESKLVMLVYNRLAEHPRALPKHHSPRCLAVPLRKRQDAGKPPIRTLRSIVDCDKRFVAPVATLVLQIRDFEKIPRRTDKSRNSNAIAVAQRELMQGVYNLLFSV
jgi:hypothetical protein